MKEHTEKFKYKNRKIKSFYIGSTTRRPKHPHMIQILKIQLVVEHTQKNYT